MIDEIRRTHWITPDEVTMLQRLVANLIEGDLFRLVALQDLEAELAAAPVRFSKVPFGSVLRFALGFKNNEIPVKLTDFESSLILSNVGIPIELESKLSKGKSNEGTAY